MIRTLSSLTFWLAALGLTVYFVLQLVLSNLVAIAGIGVVSFVAWVLIRRLANGSPYRGDGLY